MGELILVVEDEHELRATVEYNLVGAGYRTIGTAFGLAGSTFPSSGAR